MNYMKDVAALLGVQLNEEFRVLDKNKQDVGYSFKITERGLEFYIKEWHVTAGWLENLLTKEYTIERLPFKPKNRENYWTLRYTSDCGIMTAEDVWEDWSQDYLAYYNGLCFRTEEEAEANKDKLLKIIKHYEES